MTYDMPSIGAVLPVPHERDARGEIMVDKAVLHYTRDPASYVARLVEAVVADFVKRCPNPTDYRELQILVRVADPRAD